MRVAIVGGLLVAIAAASAALAASGYTVSVSAPNRVETGGAFVVKITGNAPHRSVVNVWLDPRSCASSAQAEGVRAQYKPGDSYFVDQAGGGARVNYWSTARHGEFSDTQTAHAGSDLDKQYICAYVNELGAGTNSSRASDTISYTITK